VTDEYDENKIKKKSLAQRLNNIAYESGYTQEGGNYDDKGEDEHEQGGRSTIGIHKRVKTGATQGCSTNSGGKNGSNWHINKKIMT